MWISHRLQDLAIDQTGRIEALVGLGFSQVTVQIKDTNISDSVVFDISDPSFFITPKDPPPPVSDPTPEPTPNLPFVGEFEINQYTGCDQEWPDVAMDSDGNFVVVWQRTCPGEDTGIFGQHYDSLGNAVGDEFQVHQSTDVGNKTEPAVDMNLAGDFVVTWEASDGSNDGVYARLYPADGDPIDEFLVNSYTTNFQRNPKIDINNQGDFIVVWRGRDHNEPPDIGNKAKVFARRFDSVGDPIDDEDILINTINNILAERPQVALYDSGDFVVTWQAQNLPEAFGGDNVDIDVLIRRYDSSVPASPIDAQEFVVNTFVPHEQYVRGIGMNDSGQFALSYHSRANDGPNKEVMVQRFDFDTADVDIETEIQLNIYTTGNQEEPSIAMDAEGDLVVTWESQYQDVPGDDDNGVFARRYFTNGTLSDVFQVNETTALSQERPKVHMHADGQFVIVWQGEVEETPGEVFWRIFAKRYDANGNAL